MGYEITVREARPQHVLSRRLEVDTAGLPAAIGESFALLYGHIGAAGVPPAGAPFTVYRSDPRSPVWRVDVCAPVSREIDPPAGFEAVTVPGGPVASTMHVGSYASVGSAYEALTAWIPQHGYRPADAPREVYVSPPETPEDQICTIIEWPVAAVASTEPAAVKS